MGRIFKFTEYSIICAEGGIHALGGDKTSFFSTTSVPDARLYKAFLGASIAARVVLALNAQHQSSAGVHHDEDDHHQSHEAKVKIARSLLSYLMELPEISVICSKTHLLKRIDIEQSISLPKFCTATMLDEDMIEDFLSGQPSHKSYILNF